MDRRGNPIRLTGRVTPLRFLSWFFVAGVLAVGVLILFPSLPDPTCAALLVRSEGEVAVPLPVNCARTSDVPTDEMVKYLENERNHRGLIFKGWITCTKMGQAPAAGFTFAEDRHWFPSYVPGTYQFRRTVILFHYGPTIGRGSPVVAEVCLMPWLKYIRQVATQCDGKFSVWR